MPSMLYWQQQHSSNLASGITTISLVWNCILIPVISLHNSRLWSLMLQKHFHYSVCFDSRVSFCYFFASEASQFLLNIFVSHFTLLKINLSICMYMHTHTPTHPPTARHLPKRLAEQSFPFISHRNANDMKMLVARMVLTTQTTTHILIPHNLRCKLRPGYQTAICAPEWGAVLLGFIASVFHQGKNNNNKTTLWIRCYSGLEFGCNLVIRNSYLRRAPFFEDVAPKSFCEEIMGVHTWCAKRRCQALSWSWFSKCRRWGVGNSRRWITGCQKSILAAALQGRGGGGSAPAVINNGEMNKPNLLESM